MTDKSNLDATEQCNIYYTIVDSGIYLVLQQVRFPYWGVSINIYSPWHSDFSYDEALDMIINGGEEYMLEVIRERVHEIIKRDNDYSATKTREEQVLNLGTTIDIYKDIWKKLRDTKTKTVL